MEEKILIKSEKRSVKKIFINMTIVGLVIGLIMAVGSFLEYLDEYNSHEHHLYCFRKGYSEEALSAAEKGYPESYEEYMDCFKARYNEKYGMYDIGFKYALENFTEDIGYCFMPLVAFMLVGGIICMALNSYELTVTNKRVYGKVAWGTRVDLPLDSVTSIAMFAYVKGVSVSTPSGRITFRTIKNAEDIYNVIGDLLVQRQK